MKTTIDVKQLKQALATVSPAVEKKTTIPILKSVMLREWCGALRVEATDLELAMQVTLDDAPASGEAVTVPHKALTNLLKPIKVGRITLESFEPKAEPAEPTKDGEEPEKNRDRYVTITTPGCGKIKLNGISGDSWPILPTADSGADVVNLKIPEFTAALKRVAIAISKDESRFTLNGCLFKHARGKLTLASTDGHRMLVEELSTRARKEFTALLPRCAINILSKMKLKGEVQIAIDENHFYVEIGDTLMIARKLTGNFPDYERVMPRNNDKNYTVYREPLVVALEQLLPLTDEKRPAAVFEFRPDGLRVSSEQADVGTTAFTVAMAAAAPHLVLAGYNVKYVLQFLKAVGSEFVTISLANHTSAAVLTASGQQESTYVLMPHRIDGVTLDEEDTASVLRAELEGRPEIRHIIINDAIKDAERAADDRANGREPAPKTRVRFPDQVPAGEAWRCTSCETVNASGIEVCGCGSARKWGIVAVEPEGPSAERFDELHQEIRKIQSDPEYSKDTHEGMLLRNKAVDLERQLEVHEPAAIARAQAEIDAEKAQREQESPPASESVVEVDAVQAVAYEDEEVSDEEAAAFLARVEEWMAKIIAAAFPQETTNGAYHA